MSRMRSMPGGWTQEERRLLNRLKSPERIQRFLDDEVRYNKEPDGETCRSPRRVLRDRVAHCIEAAFFGAAALRHHGRCPLVLLLRADRDDDHVITLFRERSNAGAWGAVAKSNYAGLRFREPVYRTLRELAMSYFEHYYNVQAEKSLRARGRPVDLSLFDRIGWEREDCTARSSPRHSGRGAPPESPAERSDPTAKTLHPRLEERGIWEEAEDEERLVGELEEVAGMDEDAMPLDEGDGELLLGDDGGDAEDGSPAGPEGEDIDGPPGRERGAEPPVVL